MTTESGDAATDTASAFGRAIADRRRRQGWSQAEFAARAGTTQPTISRIESGRLAGLTLRQISRLAAALGCQTVNLVLEGEAA